MIPALMEVEMEGSEATLSYRENLRPTQADKQLRHAKVSRQTAA